RNGLTTVSNVPPETAVEDGSAAFGVEVKQCAITTTATRGSTRRTSARHRIREPSRFMSRFGRQLRFGDRAPGGVGGRVIISIRGGRRAGKAKPPHSHAVLMN